jgi:hypothetical protein
LRQVRSDCIAWRSRSAPCSRATSQLLMHGPQATPHEARAQVHSSTQYRRQAHHPRPSSDLRLPGSARLLSKSSARRLRVEIPDAFSSVLMMLSSCARDCAYASATFLAAACCSVAETPGNAASRGDGAGRAGQAGPRRRAVEAHGNDGARRRSKLGRLGSRCAPSSTRCRSSLHQHYLVLHHTARSFNCDSRASSR